MNTAADRLRKILVPERIGTVLGVSDPVPVPQGMIDEFARVTRDEQWIHVDTERAATGPYGTTIAHGYLVLSLLPHFTRTVIDLASAGTVINYGLNRVRFIGPTKAGAEIVDEVTLADLTPKGDGTLVTLEHRIRDAANDNSDATTVCIAQTLSLLYW